MTFLQSLKASGVWKNLNLYLCLLEQYLPNPKDRVESPRERINNLRRTMQQCEELNEQRASSHTQVNPQTGKTVHEEK